MSRTFALPALAAAIAIPMALASGAAQAQIAQYCGGKIVANAFYNNVQSNGSRSTVSYYVQLQNRTAERIPLYAVTFSYNLAHNRQNGSNSASLPPYQQVTILLGTQTLNNASGTGALNATDVNNGVPHATSLVCASF
ncbi:MAG: hypothetical protein JWR10_4251 [Rubritepida sp.]|nr:hypothetical protein [Rubritepida sp.]